MCDCVKEVNEKLSEKNLNTKIRVPLLLDGDMNVSGVKIQIVTEKENSNIRKKPISVFSSYCPFCGEAYKEIN